MPRSVWTDIKVVIAAFLLLVAIVTVLFSNLAEGAEWFPEKPTVFLGLDYVKENPFCEDAFGNVDKSDHVVSNLGIRVPIVDFTHFRLQGGWTHHSCAFGYDAPTYDGTGLQLEWKF